MKENFVPIFTLKLLFSHTFFREKLTNNNKRFAVKSRKY